MSRWMYDVYLSFGGPDTRKTFVDHLYNGLKRNGIHVCMDDSVLGGPEVINDPIEKSRFLMVIISDKYASSSFCMRKLVKILKLSKNSSEHKIIPVFYNFDPEMVREQCGSYAEAFAKHEESNEAEVDEWRKALSMAASLYGWVLNSETNGYEYKFIDHISKEILKMLSDAPLHAGIWVHKSELNYHHPNHSKRRLAIFWDMENCCIPNGVHPQDVYDNILECLRQQTEIEWEVIMFSVYADLLNVSPKVSEGCMKADMNLRHVPNGINDGSGKAILVDLFLYAHDNPPPSSIMLISGDVGFSSALQVLHRRRHPVIFVIPSRVGILSALTYGAIDIWDWTNVVRGVGLVPSSRFQIKENSDAVNKEESMESGVSMGSQPSFEYNPDDVYDVYLSFRGLDTRKTFVDHLYNGLKRNALHVCIYDNVLGGPKEIDDVIEKSRFLMVIFSDNYASSSSCLRELVKILDLSANDPEHKFIPVFYNVTPQMVGEQCESYAGAFADHEVSNKAEVDEWRKALSMAASFPGWVINSETNGYEYKFIDDMSKEIRNMLSDAPLHAGIWVHKSELNYHHPNHSKRQLAIFWDMENCCIPNGVHPKGVYDNILACLRNQTELEWEVIRFSAYADFSNVSRNISDGCMKARMNLSHVPNVINNASGKAILVDLLFYAHDNPPPSSIMLISGDVGFSNALHVLHRRRHPVIFVIPSRLGVLSALTYGTIDIWDWSNVVRGEWLVPTSRFQIKENSDAVNKEKSMESGVSMGSQPSSEYNPDDVMPVQPGDSEAQGASAGQAESSSAGSPANQPVHEAVGQLTIPEEEPIQAAPASSKSMRFPLRPGKGKFGKRCIVTANHFFAELPDLHQYDVTITPEVTSRGMNRAVISQLVKLYKVSYLGNRLSAYDGRKSLYTAGPLPFISKDFKITLLDEDDGSGGPRREREFKVAIKLASRADLHHLGMFLKGKQADAPQEALQVLDIVLRELTTNKYTPVGRSFYDPHLGQRQFDEGLEIWRGFYQSIRPTQMGVSLNIDMLSTFFIEPLPVIVFVTELLNRDVTAGPLSDSDCVKIKEALRGVKVEVTHRGNMRRKYRISGLTSQATRELNFLVNESGMMKSVVEYFRERYGFVIQHIQWPCLQVGNPQRPNYLPMEVCKIVKGQRYSKRLSESQIIALPHVTYQRPQDMEKDILKTVAYNNYGNDDYAKEFGIKISPELASVEARILPPPWLKYHDTGREKDCLPERGVWSMMNKKMVNGGIVASWICINFADEVQDSTASTFCRELANMCNISGMEFNPDPVFPAFSARPDRVERVLKACFHEAMTRLQPQGKELDLLIVILPNKNGSLYGDLKRICETDIGIVSQCCLTKHVFKMSLQYLSNVALKINVKVGGRNTVLRDAISRRIPNVSDDPTIIFGADVIHPHPGEDSSPSIAAVVASQDWPEITKYAGLVCAQAHGQELIQDLYKDKDSGGMIKELLISFHRATGRKPQRIIFYRYGVSEGQFYQVLLYELDAIRKACASLEPNYQPPVTFVVVQKRHHTRLFPNNYNDHNSSDRSGNILAGTVVDSKICHPTEFDFYLCSHAGIKGTSRPVHYHVLWDENKFEADSLQSLTNNLCYTYARCTRSVSIVPPAYYAHLAASRARFYIEPSGAAGCGMGVRNNCKPGANAAVRPLPALKDNVKRVMFYC